MRGRYYGSQDEGVRIANNMMQGVAGFMDNMRQAQDVEQGRMAMEDEKGIRAAYEHMAAKLGQDGDIATLDGDPVLNTRHGLMALGRLSADRANTQQTRLAMLKNMEAADDKLYQDFFRPLASQAQEAYQQGNMAKFGQLVGQLSKVAPFPYQYHMGADGNFEEMFRSTKNGGWVRTGGSMAPQQVMQAITQIMSGEQKILRGADMRETVVNPFFLAAAARYRMATAAKNAAALADPKQWRPMQGKDGHIVFAIPQNAHDDYSADPAYLLFDEKNGTRRGNLRDLTAQGYAPAAAKANARKLQAAGRGAAGGYKLTNADVNMLTKYAISTNAETGEKEIDYGKAAFLQEFIQKTGLSPLSAIENYESNIQLAMSQGARSREQAERAAMVGLRQKIHGEGQVAHGKKPVSAPASQPGMAPGHQPGVHSAKEDRIKNAAAGAKPGTLDSLGSSSPEFDSYGNTINGLTNAGRAVGNWLTNTGDYADPEDVLDYRP